MDRTWILVADAGYARLFELDNKKGNWSLRREFEHVESREQGQDLMENRPNKIQHHEERTSKGANPVEFKQNEAANFARQLSQHLEHAAVGNEYERLVLVAAPKFLGLLREALPTTVRRLVSVEIDKDYSEMKPDKMAELVPVF